MYCPNCGAEATPGLNYCKRCGGSLNHLTLAPETRPAIPAGSAWAIGVTTLFLVVGGLAVLFGLMVALVESGLSPRSVVWLAALVSFTILGSVKMLMRFWTRMLKPHMSSRAKSASPSLKSPAGAGELSPARVGLFADHVGSVTENTTRTFEPSYREPQR